MLLAKLEALLQLGQMFRNYQLLNNSKLLREQANLFNEQLYDILLSCSNNDDTDKLISILNLFKKDLKTLEGFSRYYSPFWSSSQNQSSYLENPLPKLFGSLNKLENYIIKATFDALFTTGKELSCEVSRIFNEHKFSSYTEFQQQPNLLNKPLKALNRYLNKLLESFQNNSENTDLIQRLDSVKFSFENLQYFINHAYNEALNLHYFPQFWPASPYSQNQKKLIADQLTFFDNSLGLLKKSCEANPDFASTYSPSHNLR